MWYLKLILLIVFAIVLYQDCKDRMVYWFLYPIIGFLAFTIQLHYVSPAIVLVNAAVNLLFIVFLTGSSFAYIRWRHLAFQNAIGLGDILFFIFISFAFAAVSFIVLFVFALVFSLLLHLVFQNKTKQNTVPLAGYMSLFFGVVYVVAFYCNSNFLYAY